jgi:preprotein translocase subunit Sec63
MSTIERMKSGKMIKGEFVVSQGRQINSSSVARVPKKSSSKGSISVSEDDDESTEGAPTKQEEEDNENSSADYPTYTNTCKIVRTKGRTRRVSPLLVGYDLFWN